MRRPPQNSQRGLDWLNFFVANLQAAFGSFIAVYLTGAHWTQGQIGFALSIGSITAMVSQVPAGIMVDRLRDKHRVAFLSILAVIFSCLLLALFPQQLPVAVAEILHGLASCTLNPAISAITLSVVATQVMRSSGTGAGLLGERFGRNASFAAVGNAIAAGLMGAVGYWVSAQATFFLGAAMAVPGLLALLLIERSEPPASVNTAAMAEGERAPRAKGRMWDLLRDRRLFAFAVCVAFFHLSNAGMLPLAAGQVTQKAGNVAEIVIAACILLPQLVGAALSPHIGRLAETVGRRPVMLVTFAALPLRGALLATTSNPYLIVAIQMLDGLSSASFGVMMPLVAADLTRASGRFNLCMGILGLAMGAGASFSTTLAGTVADRSMALAFLMLAGAGLACVILVWLLMGDTSRPDGARWSPFRRAARPRRSFNDQARREPAGSVPAGTSD
ncbi:major facilitator superfamily transporter [Gluconacetobacter johannae DSM 13595]|uniref:MFS transporter n=1 Tax=Gluconacetobacter johannae TaxID=112140 RepID=A0A7W4J9Z6_9PROT|nr:MFS transporter [Gluconacetobacter johannae]MBB2177436.1 MFS transporter [Gluconacetobacter johannae]GBQ81658.1 major facilitator superfamily transporter [Gluconacetobacter johannae DSM 13595]